MAAEGMSGTKFNQADQVLLVSFCLSMIFSIAKSRLPMPLRIALTPDYSAASRR
jgi:hypothetical protein